MKTRQILRVCILLVLVASLSISCASTGKGSRQNPIIETPNLPVVLGKNGIARPAWVYTNLSNETTLFATGYGKMATMQNSLKRALAEARNSLSGYISTVTDEIVTMYTNDAGSLANRQVVDAFEVLSKQRSQALIEGSEQESFWEDAEGGIWVLISMPKENIIDDYIFAVDEVTHAADDFEKNEAAKEANRMMNEAIQKYFGRN